jgi:putative ABC transport system permease protein
MPPPSSPRPRRVPTPPLAHWRWVPTIWRDLRYGLRGLRRQPGFSALAILTLAVGIGAATTMFSVIDNVLLNPFPYKDAHRIATFYIHDVTRTGRGGRSYFPLPQFLEYQTQNHVFEEVIGADVDDVLYTTPEGTEQYDGAWVTVNTFAFLGVPPLMGRGIVPGDIKPGAPPVFVMAYKMWSKRFSLDPSILGRSFVLNDTPTTLVGIMPPRFTKRAADLYLPASLDPADPRNKDRGLLFQARMKPGVTLKDVEADIGVIARRLAQIYPRDYPKAFTVQADGYADSVVGEFKATLLTLSAAVGLLLLIACGNVANMLLARATAREKEMAVRASLGATRSRLIGQLLSESVLMAAAGAALGCGLAWVGIKALVRLIPDGAIPREAVIGLNLPVLLFTLGAAGFTAILFGLAPALQAARRDIADPLRDSGKGLSGGFRRGALRNTLVVAEVALSLMLLAGAGLLMRSFVALTTVDLGFNPHNILVARLPFPRDQYKTPESKQQFFRRLLPRLGGLPGVVVASETTSLPPFGGIGTEVEIPGRPHSERWDALVQLCSEGYFRTIRARLLRGRLLSMQDVEGARQTAVVNQTLVTKYFGGDDPIGRQIQLTRLATDRSSPVKQPYFEIVGVMADVRNRGLREPPIPEVLVPYSVTGSYERGILVRTAGDPMVSLEAVRREVWAVDRHMALTFTGSLDGFLQQFTFAAPRFSVILLGVFAGVATVLVAIGVFSVTAYAVSRQTQEIGIRIALGAGRASVFRMVLAKGLRLIAFGAAIGIACSLGLTRLLSDQLWHVSSRDPITMGTVVVVMMLVGLTACYFPARRATQVDPMVALRYE